MWIFLGSRDFNFKDLVLWMVLAYSLFSHYIAALNCLFLVTILDCWLAKEDSLRRMVKSTSLLVSFVGQRMSRIPPSPFLEWYLITHPTFSLALLCPSFSVFSHISYLWI